MNNADQSTAREPLGERYIRQRANGHYSVRLGDKQRTALGTFPTLAEAIAVRDAYFAQVKPTYTVAAGVQISGLTLQDAALDEEAVFAKALHSFTDTATYAARQADQTITVDFSPLCMVYTADHHFGNPGTDVGRIFAEADIINAMPQTLLATIGDLFDNFILEKMRSVRFDTTMSLQEEFILGKRYLQRIADKWRLAVDGNHDLWTAMLTGINWQREVARDIAPLLLHDSYDCRVNLCVQGVAFPGRIRHNWRGRSELNDTHGIEKAARFDQDFIWGVGAHTHRSGLVRAFNAAGGNGMAGLCGSYKRYDTYARQNGYPKANDSTAIAIIFDADTNSMTGFNNLDMAARVMHSLCKG